MSIESPSRGGSGRINIMMTAAGRQRRLALGRYFKGLLRLHPRHNVLFDRAAEFDPLADWAAGAGGSL